MVIEESGILIIRFTEAFQNIGCSSIIIDNKLFCRCLHLVKNRLASGSNDFTIKVLLFPLHSSYFIHVDLGHGTIGWMVVDGM